VPFEKETRIAFAMIIASNADRAVTVRERAPITDRDMRRVHKGAGGLVSRWFMFLCDVQTFR